MGLLRDKTPRCSHSEERDDKTVNCIRPAEFEVEGVPYCEDHLSAAEEATWV